MNINTEYVLMVAEGKRLRPAKQPYQLALSVVSWLALQQKRARLQKTTGPPVWMPGTPGSPTY